MYTPTDPIATILHLPKGHLPPPTPSHLFLRAILDINPSRPPTRTTLIELLLLAFHHPLLPAASQYPHTFTWWPNCCSHAIKIQISVRFTVSPQPRDPTINFANDRICNLTRRYYPFLDSLSIDLMKEICLVNDRKSKSSAVYFSVYPVAIFDRLFKTRLVAKPTSRMPILRDQSKSRR